MASYILRGCKQRGARVGRVNVDGDRSLVLNGAPVELSDEEYEGFQQRYVLEAADAEVLAEPDDNKGDEPEESSSDTTTSHT
jgi:hypothetical protein